MSSALLYSITVLIWGSTWLAITYQLGSVPPELSVTYRFALASAILFIFSWVRRLPLRLSLREHAAIALQGSLIFCINYILVYVSESYLTSGLVAIIFSTIVLLNVGFGALFLRNPIRPRVVLGALVGTAGLVLIFWPELSKFKLSGGPALGAALAIASAISASLGNIVSAWNLRRGLPVVQMNAYGMAYGAVFMLGYALLRGVPFRFDPSLPYVASLLYLVVFGSVIAFGSYLTLLSRIGPDRAAYVTVLFPVIALALSTLFEGFSWSLLGALGVPLVLLGNSLALSRQSKSR